MRANNLDRCQQEVCEALEEVLGALTQPLNKVKDGCPDVLVGYMGKLCVIELKNDDDPPSAQRLNAKEVDWHELWRGYPVFVCIGMQHTIDTVRAFGLGLNTASSTFRSPTTQSGGITT